MSNTAFVQYLSPVRTTKCPQAPTLAGYGTCPECGAVRLSRALRVLLRDGQAIQRRAGRGCWCPACGWRGLIEEVRR